jgi:transposase
VWFQDEARIGQKNSLTRVWGQTGSRPAAPKDLGFASAYVFGAVCPSQGKAAALIMPICNIVAMNHHLSEISGQVAADAHAVVILDGAGWHRSQGLAVPGNITLLELPPYSPELNPVERIWHYLRSHWLANSVFPSLADIMDANRQSRRVALIDHRSLARKSRFLLRKANYGDQRGSQRGLFLKRYRWFESISLQR